MASLAVALTLALALALTLALAIALTLPRLRPSPGGVHAVRRASTLTLTLTLTLTQVVCMLCGEPAEVDVQMRAPYVEAALATRVFSLARSSPAHLPPSPYVHASDLSSSLPPSAYRPPMCMHRTPPRVFSLGEAEGAPRAAHLQDAREP